MTTTPVMTTDRLILRAPEGGDLDFWRPFILSDRARFVRSAEPSDELAFRSFAGIIGHWALRGYGTFAFALKDKPEETLGAVGPWNPEGWPEPELGWTIWSAAHEGKGYVREAVEAARAWAFGTLGWPTAVSYIDPRNTASVRLALRLGAAPDWDAATPRGDALVVFRHPQKGAFA